MNATIAVTAGTPIPLATGAAPIRVRHLFVQMLAGGAGRGLIYRGFPPNTAPAAIAAAAGSPAQMSAATADSPGGTYEFDLPPNQWVDLRTFAVDGIADGDPIVMDARLPV